VDIQSITAVAKLGIVQRL